MGLEPGTASVHLTETFSLLKVVWKKRQMLVALHYYYNRRMKEESGEKRAKGRGTGSRNKVLLKPFSLSGMK